MSSEKTRHFYLNIENTRKVKHGINPIQRKRIVTDTLYCLENGERIAEICSIPLPKGDDDITRLATHFARAFSHALREKQFITICSVSPAFAQAITLGAWMAGHPVAYINPSYTETQLNEVLSQLETCLNIGTPDYLALLENKKDWLSPDPDEKGNNKFADWLQKHANEDAIVPYEWHDDECAAVIFTSGSTGGPKGVCHSIGNLTRSTELFIEHYSIDPHDRVLTLAPLHTLLGLKVTILLPLMAGCQMVENPKEPLLEDILNIYASERPTIFICGPIFFRQLAMLAGKLDDELSSIRGFISSGAKLDQSSRIRLWEKHRVPVLDHYGSTETIFAIGEHVDTYKPELGIIGKAPPGITVELAEVEGISDPELTIGQIRIHSPNLFLGYLGEPLARKRYFDTGDLGTRDATGNISLKGRLDHGVKASSTLWIFPQALEQLLVNRSDVADAHVRSEYDQYDRGILNAQVVPANPETADDGWLDTLKQDIEGQLGPDYKAVDIEITSVIARTTLGKIIKASC
jgi:acyl-coenzyme A synthetase/AMP-(fatty) acid ligase